MGQSNTAHSDDSWPSPRKETPVFLSRHTRLAIVLLLLLVAFVAVALTLASLHAQNATPVMLSPPTRPATGSGGADCAYDAVDGSLAE